MLSREPSGTHRVTAKRLSSIAPEEAAHQRLVSEPTVSPRRHVYFLKTHKCASTTVQRIIVTYAMKHNLSMALPLREDNCFFPAEYSPRLAKQTCAHPHFDVMAAHARFSTSAIGFMPNDTFFVSVVRDPADQMESAYKYFLVGACSHRRLQNPTFEEYVLHLIRQKTENAKAASVSYPCGSADLQFLQLFDLGLNMSPPPTKDKVIEHVAMLDRVFDLVLITENLDEGLILMRDMLGWTTDDIIYFKSNFRATAPEPISKKARQAAYALNWADKMLYDHFKAKMDTMIRQQERYLLEQVREFRRLQSSRYDHCIAKVKRNASGYGNGPAGRVGSYILSDGGKNDYWCHMATIPEKLLFRGLNLMNPICRFRQ